MFLNIFLAFHSSSVLQALAYIKSSCDGKSLTSSLDKYSLGRALLILWSIV